MNKTNLAFKNAVLARHQEAMQDIHLPDKNIAIYQRDIAPLQSELAALRTEPIECRANGSTEMVLAMVRNYFAQHLPNHSALLEDVKALFTLFGAVTGTDSFRLLLTTVSTNMCRKFHTDINDLRLLCTYLGPGTLWLPDEAVDLKALQTTGSKRYIVKDHQLIQQAQTGDVVLLKGALYPDANPILHRSPVIEDQGLKRLFLRIDTDANQKLWL